MENKQSPSKKKLKSIQEEKFIREVDYDSFAEGSSHPPKKLLLEIFQRGSPYDNSSQKVLVSIKPRAPAIKTLYIAEKSRFHTKKHTERSGSRLAIGDHSSHTTCFSEDDSNTVNSIVWGPTVYVDSTKSEIITGKSSSSSLPAESSTLQNSKCSNTDVSYQNVVYNPKKRSAEKCYVYTQPPLNMSRPNHSKNTKECNLNKVDIGTLVVTNPPDDIPPHNIVNLNRRIEHLERKLLRQEMVFRSLDPSIPLSSSDEESKNHIMRVNSNNPSPGCSYVEYSHVPKTSAFQRYTQQPAPLSASKATTIQKEHNSEQYGRDFTLYDGITARGRRQCASVPCKRDAGSKMAAERVHKIRHKLNPVRDYRLMDTVHYLAQGEFAPRDDGIKLTPSREAVLSDIIWEDVCRTHWPNARLARRMGHPERYGPRSELQRLIDSLLRERVAHVERRRRRHYRIVKLNHRHESCRPLGKTGDIIVASHKSRQNTDEREVALSDHNAVNEFVSERRRNERHSHRQHRSHDRLIFPETRNRKQFRQDDCSPGTSYAADNSTGNREPTCCYHACSPSKAQRCPLTEPNYSGKIDDELARNSSKTSEKVRNKNPRLVVKKNSSRKKSCTKEEPNLEHYILLPTLVVKSPSNMRRQKKFNELYHRILNVQLNQDRDITDTKPEVNPQKKDVGLNINITLSNSEV
ncbi:uncharacterized protein LOC116770475 [Danaus plexippus]|uniref:Uncharacterized protein n=1 Tax=Danaus plexippus plexippus TaxID=278856 RepID=A0A212EHZ2_DANPL|nr:uncharacterized protein LOC116770475 [Danaus plexippus]OWR41102.1 hypothetical protein KGM_209765 [Danaus plexippus plexippus]